MGWWCVGGMPPFTDLCTYVDVGSVPSSLPMDDIVRGRPSILATWRRLYHIDVWVRKGARVGGLILG